MEGITMKKIIYYWNCLFILFVAAVSYSCVKDGDLTVVIEDGQPEIEELIIGKWRPSGMEATDMDGNSIDLPSGNFDIPELTFGEGGSGTAEGGDEGESGSFNWEIFEGDNTGGEGNYDGNSPYFNFGGEKWYIFQLTERILILYRFYGDYIIIYYYEREGDYVDSGDDGDGADDDGCYFNPLKGDMVKRIRVQNVNPYYEFEQNLYFEYDKYNRIDEFSFGLEDNINWTCKYKYDKDRVTASINDDLVFVGELNKDGYIKTISDGKEEYAWYDYNENGYLFAGKTSNDYMSVDYDNNWNAVEVHVPYWDGKFKYSYALEKNYASIDLNKVLSISGGRYEATRTDFIGFFGYFGFFGKPGPQLISSEEHYSDKYTLEYKHDSKSRIEEVVKWDDAENKSYTKYFIYYE